jgi:serine/threonine-protein kinase
MIKKEIDLSGKTLSNYKIVGKLGSGGMATVYKAHELSLNRMVALKVLSSQLSEDKEYIKRFQREAQAAAQLNHPNIVQIFSIGEEKGLHYFAMELIKGKSLAQIKKEEGVLQPEKAVTVIQQVADALSDAHRAGLVHRDIKPSNIMIDELGRGKVTDFGIAYVTSAQTKLTREGSIIGTPEYLSPEQCEGKTVDGRSDIYSLGVTLYELLTGKTPYEADTPVSMLMKIVQGNFPPIGQVNPKLPKALCKVVEKMMVTDVNKRYASMKEVLDDLDALQLAEAPTPAPTKQEPATEMVAVGAAGEPLAEKRSNKWAAVIVAAVIVLLMGGAFAAKLLIFDKKKPDTPNDKPAVAEKAAPAESQSQMPGEDTADTEDTAGTEDTADTTAAAEDTEGTDTGESTIDTAATNDTQPGDAQASINSGSSASGESTGSTGTADTGTAVSPAGKPTATSSSPSSSSSSPSTSPSSSVSPATTPSATQPAPKPAVKPAPPANSCIISTLGDSDKADIVGSYVQEILGRKNYRVVDGPSVAGREIADVARNHIVIKARQLGTTTLNYYGNSSEQYSVSLTIQLVSPKNGTIVAGPVSRTVKYTALNAEENLREAVAKLVAALKL